MNTKFFKSLAAVAVAVLTVGCAKEQGTQEGPANVTFEIENPVAVTKAIGDGTTAKKLYYQVFDATGNPIAGLPVQWKTFSSLKTTVSFQLVKDQKYNFIFWAQTPVDGYYTIDGTEGLKKITADYTTHKVANDENRDAFFAVEKDLVISGPVSKTVTLTRPLAQVNIGTLDELKAGTTTAPAIDLTGATSKVVVKDVPTVFAPLATTPETMFSGASDVTFEAAAVPTEKLSVKGVKYDYLAMNYVFAPAEGTVCDLTAEFSLKDMAPISLSSPATPLKRNYRTNILGKLLTSTADFEIIVDPTFDGDISPATGYRDGGAVEALPDAPIKKGNVWKVNSKNYQYVLDGAYGNISGKTIHFTESIDKPLVLGRPTKFSGSSTRYMVGGFDNTATGFMEFATAEELVAYKAQSSWTPGVFYIRSLENVTFTADEGVTIKGLYYYSGFVSGTSEKPIYDYVRDSGVWCPDNNNGYRFAAKFENISFEGISFIAVLNMDNSASLTDINGLNFRNCSFNSGTMGTDDVSKMCIRIGNWVKPYSHCFRNIVVDNCTFKNSAHGVYCNAAYGVKVVNSTFVNLINPAVNLQNTVFSGYGVSEISKNTFTDITDRIIRINKLSKDTELTIKDNVSTNSGRSTEDGKRLIMKAEGLEDGIIYHISGNNWNGGTGVVQNEELKDSTI